MQAWEDFLVQQEKAIGHETVAKWLRSLKVSHFDACNLYLEAGDTFQAIWFEEHIKPQLKGLLLNNNNHPIKVHLKVGGAAPQSLDSFKKLAKKKKSSAVDFKNPVFHFSPDSLDPYASFDHFLCSDANQVPFRLLSQLVSIQNSPNEIIGDSTPLSMFNPIYIHGGSGTGKSHLLMATANRLLKANLNVFFVRAETFTEHVVNAIRNGVMQDFRMAYRHVDVLIVDDVHIFGRKGATQEEFFHTFNTLHTSGRQIILSANCAPQHLTDIEPRLVSRFEWGITLQIEKMEPFQFRQFIQKRALFLNFDLKEEIVDFLVKSFSPNIKAVQKALDTLILRSHVELSPSLNPEGLNLEMAESYLTDLIEEQEKSALNPQKIVQEVANFYGITPDDIFGESQSQDCSIPRQISMYLCRKELKMPFIKLGKIFSRDHSTVMSSVKLIEKKIEKKEKDLCASIRDISRKIES